MKNNFDVNVIVKKIVGLNFVKMVVYGIDVNWGWIIGVIGYFVV